MVIPIEHHHAVNQCGGGRGPKVVGPESIASMSYCCSIDRRAPFLTLCIDVFP